jgi:hypothetical protein
MMENIFIFTAAESAARKHLEDTILRSISETTVFSTFDEKYHTKLQKIKNQGNGFYAWGAVPGKRNEPTWKRMIQRNKAEIFRYCIFVFHTDSQQRCI